MDGEAFEREDRGDAHSFPHHGFGQPAHGPSPATAAGTGAVTDPATLPTWGATSWGSPPSPHVPPPYLPPPVHEAPGDEADEPSYGGALFDADLGEFDRRAEAELAQAQTGELPLEDLRRELEPVRPRRLARREPATDDDDLRAIHRTMPLWKELPLLLLVAFCLAVLIRTFLLQAFYIPSGSMEQTLLVGDRVLVNKIVYDVREPERGEVVVFRGTDSWAPENPALEGTGLFSRIGQAMGNLVGVSRPGEKDFIKRVIGLPGDRVSCCDPAGRIYVNGKGIDEPYISVNSAIDATPNPRACGSRRFDEVLVPPGQLFVMGDHRIVSQDSRCQGTVPIENVIGRAFVIVWPTGRWDTLSVPESLKNVPGPVAIGAQSSVPSVPGAAIVTLPLLASVIATARSGRKPRWGRRTLRR